jgi:hypothetical protein
MKRVVTKFKRTPKAKEVKVANTPAKKKKQKEWWIVEAEAIKNSEAVACPLCGGVVKKFAVGGWGQVKCEECNLRLECRYGVEVAVAMWNTRAELKEAV